MDYTTLLKEAVLAGHLSESARQHVEIWLANPKYADFREQVEALIRAANWEELNDGFYQVLPFGTGGRRGRVGPGPNCLNSATVADAAQGVANTLKSEVRGRRPKVVIAYDTRLTSPAFTEKTACVLAGNDIEVFLFDGPRATPLLSFMIRHLRCDAGIVVSASHNPPQDNGLKAYWSDGGQVVPPLDGKLIQEVMNVNEIAEITFAQACGRGLITRLGPEHDQAYFASVLAQSLCEARDVSVVYSPLHGTGVHSILNVLRMAGFSGIHLVENQKDPDGRFPNVPHHQPNPEVSTGLDGAIALGQAIGADIVMASDPDGDRLACAVRRPADNRFVILTGNQCAAIMMEHIVTSLRERGALRPEYRVYSTCVSSPLMPTIARQAGLSVKDDLLVGFKWIAEQIEAQPDPDDFLFGSEESIGFMKGARTRDKDGAVAALLLAEIAAKLKTQGRTLLDLLDDIYRSYGYFSDLGTSVFLEGLKGKERMTRIMDSLRQSPPERIGEHAVVRVIDRKTGRILGVQGEDAGRVEGPPSDLLIFDLRADRKSWIAVRPSGTEPKIKFYFSLFTEVGEDLDSARAALDARIRELKDATVALAMGIE